MMNNLRIAFLVMTLIGAGCLLLGCSKKSSDTDPAKETSDKIDEKQPTLATAKVVFHDWREKDDACVRFATFNIALNRKNAGELVEELNNGKSEQAKKVASVIRKVNPDVLLLNELDEAEKSLEVFLQQYLYVTDEGESFEPYSYLFFAAVNTGVPSGLDLDQDGKIDGPGDAFGFGNFPGQYGMAVLSRYPIEKERIRTFQDFLWRDLGNVDWPKDPKTGKEFYSQEAKEVLRLSSKSHWSLPIKIDENQLIHFLVSHPTPPVFDGPEDRNGIRNADEIRFWTEYIDGSTRLSHSMVKPRSCVIAGDLNADPVDGDSRDGPITRLFAHPHLNGEIHPASRGAVEASKLSGGANRKQKGNPAFDTGDFNDESVGNLRTDYVIPSVDLEVTRYGVFWPTTDDPDSKLNQASDHHLVWLDIKK